MKISKHVKVIKLEEQTQDILCNNCGLSCSNSRRKNLQGYDEFSGLIEAQISGGYDSEVFGDMTTIRFSICEHCVGEMVSKFKIPYEIKGDLTSEFVPLPIYDEFDRVEQNNSRINFIKELITRGLKKEDLVTLSLSELHALYNK